MDKGIPNNLTGMYHTEIEKRLPKVLKPLKTIIKRQFYD